MARAIPSIATAALAFSAAALAQPQNEPPATQSVEQQAPVDEEVIVRGRRTLLDLRNELEAARERVWDIFNEINSDDEFDISCMDAARTGSRIGKRSCQPQYAVTATSRAGKALARHMSQCNPMDGLAAYSICVEKAIQNGSAEGQQELARSAIMDKRLDQEFRRLAQERPELAGAILEFLSKEREYDEAARSRRD